MAHDTMICCDVQGVAKKSCISSRELICCNPMKNNTEKSNSNSEKINIFGKTLRELEVFFESLGEKKFRAAQIFQWMYKRGITNFDEMSDLSKSLRDKLHASASILTDNVIKIQTSGEKENEVTRKILFQLSDGEKVEAVYIPDEGRKTVCISSQVGCAVACQFCATGWMGFRRHLTVGEIVGQLMYIRREIDPDISNIVFMGMGEPFLNYENVMNAAAIITSEHGPGLSSKRITISTSGIIPKIYEFADSDLPYNLAISVNATTDEVRQKVMPITKKYPLKELLESIQYLNARRKNPATLEYVLLAGVNDSDDDAKRLRTMAKQLGKCKVNVIPYNPIEGPDLKRPSAEHIARFMKLVSGISSPLTLRRSRGRDIAAACGQLAIKEKHDV